MAEGNGGRRISQNPLVIALAAALLSGAFVLLGVYLTSSTTAQQALDAKIDGLSREMSKLSEKITTHEGRINDLSAQMSATTSALNGVQQQENDLSKVNDRIVYRLDCLLGAQECRLDGNGKKK